MAAPFTRSIICPVLIGRGPHIDALVQVIEQAWSGHGQTVLISGEAGIGNTRLVAEALASSHASRSQDTSPLVLQGRCFEPDRSLPYAPLLDLLRSFLASHSAEDIAAALDPSARALVKLLPELATFLPESLPASIPEPEQEKHQLFQVLTRFFTRLSAAQPLLIIIEDVHWSDESSLEFLLYLARRIASQRVLLLLTYRSEEEHPVLTPFLAALDRERLAVELTLTPLTIDQVGEMIRSIFWQPGAMGADFVDAIYRLTEGNPFFIEELLKSLVTAGEIVYTDGIWDRKSGQEDQAIRLPDRLQLPRSVQLAVQQRLDHLSTDARELLALAAVAGRRFDFDLLQQLTQRDEAEMLRLVKELITAQLVVEEAEDVLAFRHALTRQAVYTDLLARERRALHHSVALAMEQMYAGILDAHLGDLAYHFYMAREWAKVLDYARRAAEKAQRLYAPRAALEYLTHAIEAAHHLSMPLPLDLYHARGHVYQTLGEFELARSDFEQALNAALASHDRLAEWQSLLALGDLWTERDYEQAGTHFDRAIELAREMGDQLTLAHTLNRVGNWYANREQPHEGLHYHQEALGIFQHLHNSHGLAETFDFLGTTSLMSGLLLSGITYYEQAIALWRSLGNRQALISGLGMATMRGPNYLSDTLIWLPTNNAACIHDAEEAVALARQIDWRSGEAFALIFLGLALTARGEYSRVLTCGQAALDIAGEIEHGLWMTFAHFLLGSLSLDLLALPSARRHFEQAHSPARENGSLFWLRIITGSLASTCIAQQEYARAEAVLSAVTDSLPLNPTIAQRIAWCAYAELELARGHFENALQIVDQLIASAQIEPGGVIPRLWHLRGKALIACDRKAEAEVVLHQPALSPRRAAKQTFGGLTERERQVARLIALGKSNRALAEELIVSERTIEKHVERIMAKLGFDSRSQIAVWAIEKDLLRQSL
jgi:DNA-binding CsgD family transcriptional regulator